MSDMKTVGMAVLVALLLSGCARINTRVVEKPRVDQEVAGNRGYLMGSGPAPAQRRTTRQMIETNVELPTMEEMNPWRKPKAQEIPPTSAPASAVPSGPSEPVRWEPPIEQLPEEEFEPSAPAAVTGGTPYTVQKGDTLQKISQKFYGTTRKWNRIYEANRNVLRSPNRVYPGQKLVIPELDDSAGRRAPSEEDLK